MDITLKEGEAQLLKLVLTTYFSDLRTQIYEAGEKEVRQALRQHEAVVESLIDRLDGTHPRRIGWYDGIDQ